MVTAPPLLPLLLHSTMLPRSQRSIFHLGEEGGVDHGKNKTDIHQYLGAQNHGRRRRERDPDVVVGLQILIHQQQQHHRHPRQCHIVLKHMVWPPARHRRPCSFLRACSLCRRELSPNKDVYMYRGDQGFCSEKCRWQQMMTDEAREREAMVKKERRGLSHHHHHHGTRSTAAVRGAPRRLLAVA